MVSKIICSCIICKKEYPVKGIYTHYNQAHNPNWVNNWKEANNDANERRRQTILKNKQERHNKIRAEYEIAPAVCTCGKPKPFEMRRNKYCSASCAATSANIARGKRSEETKRRISEKLLHKYSTGEKQPSRTIKKVCRVCFHECTVCGSVMISRSSGPTRKTCSYECRTHACVGVRPYKNGRRLISYYFNKHQDKEVMLESSWEVIIANFLDKNDIKWIRPSYIKWYDPVKDKLRLYYPDFYLPDIDLYLDPKNPTAIRGSIDKMDIVTKLIPLVYGSLENVTSRVIEMYLEKGKIVEP